MSIKKVAELQTVRRLCSISNYPVVYRPPNSHNDCNKRQHKNNKNNLRRINQHHGKTRNRKQRQKIIRYRCVVNDCQCHPNNEGTWQQNGTNQVWPLIISVVREDVQNSGGLRISPPKQRHECRQNNAGNRNQNQWLAQDNQLKKFYHTEQI